MKHAFLMRLVERVDQAHDQVDGGEDQEARSSRRGLFGYRMIATAAKDAPGIAKHLVQSFIAGRTRWIDVFDRHEDQHNADQEDYQIEPGIPAQQEQVNGQNIPVVWEAFEIMIVGFGVSLAKLVGRGKQDQAGDHQTGLWQAPVLPRSGNRPGPGHNLYNRQCCRATRHPVRRRILSYATGEPGNRQIHRRNSESATQRKSNFHWCCWIARMDSKPQTAPVAVKRCTPQASAFWMKEGGGIV